MNHIALQGIEIAELDRAVPAAVPNRVRVDKRESIARRVSDSLVVFSFGVIMIFRQAHIARRDSSDDAIDACHEVIVDLVPLAGR
jgi:hypothetical protein